MLFEWDGRKDALNLRKHRVSFAEAQTAFFDEKARVYEDPDHSRTEDRFLLLGMSERGRVLVIVHCLRASGDVIRIVSARRATRAEISAYVED